MMDERRKDEDLVTSSVTLSSSAYAKRSWLLLCYIIIIIIRVNRDIHTIGQVLSYMVHGSFPNTDISSRSGKSTAQIDL